MNKHFVIRLLNTTLVSAMLSLSCAITERTDRSALASSNQIVSDVLGSANVRVTHKTASVSSTSYRAKLDNRSLQGVGSPSAIYFLNSREGWLGTDIGLFTTSDGGNTWVKTYSVERGFSVKFIRFSDSTHGWILLQSSDESILDHQADQIAILEVQNGENWTTRYREKSVVATGFEIVGESGWMTGIKYGPDLKNSRNVVLRLNSQENWIDVSSPLNNREAPFIDGALGIFEATPNSARIITAERKIYETIDRGESWSSLGNFQKQNYVISGTGKSGAHSDWLIEAVTGVEGTDSRFLLIQRSESCKEILMFGLANYFLRGAIYADENRLLAFGERITSDGNHERKRTVVLISENNGNDWTTLYQNNAAAPFVTAASNGVSIFLVNSNGLLVKVDLYKS